MERKARERHERLARQPVKPPYHALLDGPDPTAPRATRIEGRNYICSPGVRGRLGPEVVLQHPIPEPSSEEQAAGGAPQEQNQRHLGARPKTTRRQGAPAPTPQADRPQEAAPEPPQQRYLGARPKERKQPEHQVALLTSPISDCPQETTSDSDVEGVIEDIRKGIFRPEEEEDDELEIHWREEDRSRRVAKKMN